MSDCRISAMQRMREAHPATGINQSGGAKRGKVAANANILVFAPRAA
jgi:hypothetical protein